MLSNLANYLLGYAEPSVPTSIDEDVRLTAVETEEDDWLMVEKSEETDGVKSRRGSATSLPCLSLEESWFITPPPCFTSTGPVTVETSPLENLLIEHPSMSVYHHGGVEPAPVPQPPRARSLSPQPPTPTQTPHHYLHLQLVTAHKHQPLRVNQGSKRNQLERGNKAREVNSRNKRHCRKDRQKNHSGANNNRKCC